MFREGHHRSYLKAAAALLIEDEVVSCRAAEHTEQLRPAARQLRFQASSSSFVHYLRH